MPFYSFMPILSQAHIFYYTNDEFLFAPVAIRSLLIGVSKKNTHQ
jgi:hypothetical protein